MMSKIIHLTDPKAKQFDFYFCDANIWIAALKYFTADEVLNNDEALYCDFFQELIAANLNNDSDRNPKIILNSLLLSEIINTYLRKVAMVSYFGSKFSGGLSFKGAYRDNPKSNYKEELRNLIDDISNWNSCDVLYLVDDIFSKSSPFASIEALTTTKIDFNDLQYIEIAKNNNAAIISHDQDFQNCGHTIITLNKRFF